MQGSRFGRGFAAVAAAAALGGIIWALLPRGDVTPAPVPASRSVSQSVPATPSHSVASPSAPASPAAAKDPLADVVTDARFPLGTPQQWKGPYSSRTTYRVEFEGAPLWPLQEVAVQRDAQGNITDIRSQYSPPTPPSNAVVLSEERARAVAEADLQEKDPQARALPGLAATQSVNAVVWVQDREAGSPSRRAFVVVISGREVVVDATDGTILARRDRRQR